MTIYDIESDYDEDAFAQQMEDYREQELDQMEQDDFEYSVAHLHDVEMSDRQRVGEREGWAQPSSGIPDYARGKKYKIEAEAEATMKAGWPYQIVRPWQKQRQR